MTADQSPSHDDASESAQALLGRLRAEAETREDDKVVQALLLHECGVLTERRGEEPAAARDYLAAFNADPRFREPLEALVRILSRRKSVKNLGKLLEALARAAETSAEQARANWEHALYLMEYEDNVEEAKARLEEAVTADPEDPTPWLELELIAAKTGDVSARMRAIEARAELAADPTWKALLYVELAVLTARAGETSRAYELLDAAAALEGHARFRTRLVLEQIATESEDAEALARALEGQAELIVEAAEDEAHGDAIGVPKYMRRPEVAAEAWFRAAEIRRRLGEAGEALALLNAAAQRLPQSSVIARARLVALELSGEAEQAAAISREELDRGATGPTAASLWLRLAEAAALAADRTAALSALQHALEADPHCIPARALAVDLLGDGQEPGALAASVEACAEAFQTDEAKGRAYLLASYVWACRAGDKSASKAALSQASMCGMSPRVVARTGRALASITGDEAWFEDSTKRLLAAGAEVDEAPGLWFELGRMRLLRGEIAGANEAFAALAMCGGLDGEPGPAAWLGRTLEAFASYALANKEEEGEVATPSPAALDALAGSEPDPALARGYSVVSALRSSRQGEGEAARGLLSELFEQDPSDEIVAVFLSTLQRRAGDGISAADTLQRCADALEDAEMAVGLRIEAAILLWRSGERNAALEVIEGVREQASDAVASLHTWALRGADADSLDGRRRALAAAMESGADEALNAIERFGLELAYAGEGGDDGNAALALGAADETAAEDAAVAACLARLVWEPGLHDREDLERALARLDDRGPEAQSLARAERLRVARDVEMDPDAALEAAQGLVAIDSSLPAAVEWLSAAHRAERRGDEVRARRLVAQHLTGEAKAAIESSAAIVAMLEDPGNLHPLVDSEHAPGQLMNLELAPPGCDPRRRAAALHSLNDCLGADAQLDAIAMAGWSDLAAGDSEEAFKAFQAVVEARPDDVASWEGVRSAAEALGDHVQAALAAAQLGALCKDDARAAMCWEMAGLILLEHTDAHEDAEIAFERAFERDPTRFDAFDKLFRRVRSRNEDDRLLTIIAKRLEVADDEAEIAKLFWERARVLRKQGNREGALAALENVTMLEPDHVGALALSGEICITKGAFADAAPLLARLSKLDEAPQQQRLMSGVAAVDLYENKLGEPEKALDILLGLHEAGLSTLPVRERLAKSAAANGAWEEATKILEQLMNERDDAEGRIEASRLAMAIYRDKIGDPLRAQAAAEKLLLEVADDGEALDLVLTTGFDAAFRTRALGRGKTTIVQKLAKDPCDADRVSLLAKIAGAGQDAALRQSTLGVLVALGRKDPGLTEELERIDARVPSRPSITVDGRALAEIADPQDSGPVAELFAMVAETVAQALGPSLSSLGVGRRDRLDGRGGHPLRLAVAEWMGALGFEGDFEVYIGGPTPRGVHGVAGEEPALVIGPEVTTPLDAAARSAIAREVFALRRGISAVRTRDDSAIASVAIAACNEAGLGLPNPGFAVYSEVSRAIHKEMPRRVRKAIGDVCQRFAASGQDPKTWANAARRSIDRMAVIAAGDVSLVLADMLGVDRAQLGEVVPDYDRARRLLTFVLSPSYLELRKKLGMGAR